MCPANLFIGQLCGTLSRRQQRLVLGSISRPLSLWRRGAMMTIIISTYWLFKFINQTELRKHSRAHAYNSFRGLGWRCGVKYITSDLNVLFSFGSLLLLFVWQREGARTMLAFVWCLPRVLMQRIVLFVYPQLCFKLGFTNRSIRNRSDKNLSKIKPGMLFFRTSRATWTEKADCHFVLLCMACVDTIMSAYGVSTRVHI